MALIEISTSYSASTQYHKSEYCGWEQWISIVHRFKLINQILSSKWVVSCTFIRVGRNAFSRRNAWVHIQCNLFTTWSFTYSVLTYLTHCPLGDFNEILSVICELILVIDDWNISWEMTLRLISPDLTNAKSTGNGLVSSGKNYSKSEVMTTS